MQNIPQPERSVVLKIAPSDRWRRGRVIPGCINIEQQADGDETRKHQDEKEAAGGEGWSGVHVFTHYARIRLFANVPGTNIQ